MVVSLNYCSQNGGNVYRAPYYNGNPNIGPRIIGNLDQYPYMGYMGIMEKENGNYYILSMSKCPQMLCGPCPLQSAERVKEVPVYIAGKNQAV